MDDDYEIIVEQFSSSRDPNASLAVGNSHHNSNMENSSDSKLNYVHLMQLNACYEAMPTSSKMVVFDTKLQLKKAFNGLIYQNTRHVLLSDSAKNNAIVGILSVTDFIRVLLLLHKMKKERKEKQKEDACDKEKSSVTNKADVNENTNTELNDDSKQSEISEGANAVKDAPNEDIGTLTISEYRDLVCREGKLMDLVSITAEESLLKAAFLLSKQHIHRLPVLDPNDGSPLFILTHKRILKFLWLFGQSLYVPGYHNKTCKELGVGTYNGIRVVYPDTSLIFCLDILLNKGVSGVPVVEHNTLRVVDMYSRFDAIGVALEDKIDELDVTVQEALAFRNTFRLEKDRVVAISANDSLWTAITVLVERNVHRLCVLKDSGRIEGLISLSDIMNFLVVNVAELQAENLHCHSRFSQHSRHSSLGILPEGLESTNDPAKTKAGGEAEDSLEGEQGAGELHQQFDTISIT
uniref:CBS domain-containing protein n=1 Tax=Elaeophora elaphi TaxID=1147741 RepID=A0A0R3RUG7_9BILA